MSARENFPSLKGLLERLDATLFGPADTRLCAWLRIGFGILATINLGLLAADMELWFGETGAVPYEAGRDSIDPDTLTLFSLLPKAGPGLIACGWLMVASGVMLTLGLFSRVNAALVFVWMVSVQHRNHMLFDGEDIFFRLFAFFLIFLPIGARWSVDAWRRKQPAPERSGSAWALYLIRIQLVLIYLSTAWLKLMGEEWLDGSAMWYVYHLEDAFDRVALPAFLTEPLWVLKTTGWLVVAVEAWLVIGLWFRETRRFSIALGIALHLALELTMNLFLFEWLMMLGLTSFLRGDEIAFWKRRKKAPASEQAGESVETVL